MDRIDYYAETIQQSLEENGVLITRDQALSTARDVLLSIENEGQAFYRPDNPLKDTIEKLEQKLKDAQDVAEQREAILSKKIASHYGRPENFIVSIDSDRVRVSYR